MGIVRFCQEAERLDNLIKLPQIRSKKTIFSINSNWTYFPMHSGIIIYMVNMFFIIDSWLHDFLNDIVLDSKTLCIVVNLSKTLRSG